MVKFYLSPTNFGYYDYACLLQGILALGWQATHVWPVDVFRPNTYLKSKALTQAVKAISRSDMFIAYMPGSSNTVFELGLAYAYCEEIFIAAKDPVYFVQTGWADSYIPSLINIKRCCCNHNELPLMLRSEYAYLVSG